MARSPSYSVLATRLGALIPDAATPADMLVALESLGIPRVWLPHLLGLDPLPVFAAAAARTSTITFGTAVTPTWPRHPIALMQAAFAVHAVSGGRLTLGVGVSDVQTIRDTLGLRWRDPIGHLREYLTVCAQAGTGQVDFDGDHYQVHVTLSDVPPERLPIVASALNPRAIETAVQRADGLVTLLTPPAYLSATVRPRIESRISDGPFSMIACVPAAVTHRAEAATAKAREIYGPFWNYTGYAAMLRASGASGITDVTAIGTEDAVAAQFEQYAAVGVTEIAAAPFPVPEDPGALERTVRFIAALSRGR